MIRSQLNSYSGADPIWGFVALIGSERYTGGAAVGIDPRIRLFAVDGRVYFAEREGDAPVGTRLAHSGVVSTAQLEAGVVQIGETTSLARLFQRQPSIDRDAVELTLELATESLLESVADKAVGMPEVFPLRHHSSGVHHWLRDSAAASSLPVTDAFATAAPADDLRLIKAVAVQAVAVQAVAVEEVAVEEVAVEAALAVEEAVIEVEPVVEVTLVEAAVAEEEAIVEAAVAVEEAVVEVEPEVEPVVEVTLVEETFAEEAFVYEAGSEEQIVEGAIVEEAVIDEPVIEEAVIEEAVIEELVVEPASAFVLPTLSSFVLPTAEVDHDEAMHVDEFQPVFVADETRSSVEAAIVEEPASEVAPATEPTLAPILLASLTLPILHTMSTPVPAPTAPVATEPATARTADDFSTSFPEQPTYTPVHPFVLARPATGLPKLASCSDSTSDLVAANPAPVATFGEPTHNLAAVDIWEMVDVLTDDRCDGQQELVGSGASEKRGRSWLRGKKG